MDYPKIILPVSEPGILLHACCAPCSGAIIECMKANGLRPSLFYSNSNIFPLEEYEHRRSECERFCAEMDIPFIEDPYVHAEWLEAVGKGREDMPERGPRCLECFRYRLSRAALYASQHGFDLLTTTLASSRWKSLNQINEAGAFACSQVEGVSWWEINWRKGGLQERRGEIIRERNFYNQLYCGCEFSIRNTSDL